jgi:hypothetical protein
MNNLLLHPSYNIDEKWDLKGRIPKPGTLLFHKRRSGQQPNSYSLLVSLSLSAGKQGRFADKVDRSKKVLKDNDLLDR